MPNGVLIEMLHCLLGMAHGMQGNDSRLHDSTSAGNFSGVQAHHETASGRESSRAHGPQGDAA